jgi:predicted negative regulator of RcsB-dependent stress response
MITTLWIAIGVIMFIIGVTNYRINTNTSWMHMNTESLGSHIATTAIEEKKLQDQIDELKKKKDKN